MKQAIKALEQLEGVLDVQIPPKQKDDTLRYVRDTIDAVVAHLKKKENNVSVSRPCDLDEREETAQCVALQIDTMTDAMTRLKTRFDKAVVKSEYTNELHEVVRDMCMLGEMTIGLTQKLNQF